MKTENAIDEFRCSSCLVEFCGEPALNINGCRLCAACRDAKVYTTDEIARYLGGWAMGGFNEVRKLGIRVTHNALHQLIDEQDGIEASRKRDQPK